MSKIYLYCLPTGTGSGIVSGSTSGGDVIGFALAEDGMGLASHLSSNTEFSKHDMGLTSKWKHDIYGEHYPDGYELEWVEDPESHKQFQAALAENHKLEEAEKKQ